MMVPIPPPVPAPPRRVDGTVLPPYRFIPGFNPHPYRHGSGHMYTNGSPPEPPVWDPNGLWHQDRAFLLGCDLFDHRYVWEAHEAWEGIWQQVPRDDPRHMLLQALIQAAASLLKAHVGQLRGSLTLAARAQGRIEHLMETTGPEVYGVTLSTLHARMSRFHDDGTWPLIPTGLEPDDDQGS